MADKLEFAGTTVCSPGAGDVYSRRTLNLEDVVAQDVAFPQTKGRTLKIVSTATTPLSSLVLGFSGRMYRVDRATLQSHIATVQGLRTNVATAVGTLSFTDGTFSNMRLARFTTGPLWAVADGRTMAEFSAEFAEYAA
jgi:hypothetical protein